jgi:predicted transcriptional regulator of viral defense system
LPAEWFITDLMAYLEQPYYVGLLSAASLHGSAHQQPQQFQIVTTTAQREVRKKGLTIRFFFKTNFNATPVTKIKVQTGIFPFLHQKPLQLISSAMQDPSADWIAQ